MERQIILKSLRNNEWSRVKTAKSLKISYRLMLYKMRDARFTGLIRYSLPERTTEHSVSLDLND